jgi:hypothetical protein
LEIEIKPENIDRLPDKTIILLSSGNFQEQGFTVKRVELRLYQQKMSKQTGPYSIITTYVETDKGSVERILDQGYRGYNAIEDAAAFVTSHPLISDIILRSVLQLKNSLQKDRT